MNLAAQELHLAQQLDYLECKADPRVFIARHVKIETPTGQVIPFILWAMQRITLHTIHTHDGTIVLKARRLGLSWIALAYALWIAIFQQGSRIMILCKNEDDASELLDRVRRMRDRLAEDPASAHLLRNLRPGNRKKRQRDAVTTLDVGRSVLRALVGTAKAARSETAALLILDEFAFQKEADGIWQGAQPTIEGGGKVVCVSTGNGKAGQGAEFAKQWSNASSGENDYGHLFWPWDAHPHRTPEWYELERRRMGDDEKMRVEYPAVPDDAFIAPGIKPTFMLSGVDAAESLGRKYAALLRAGKMPPPDGGTLQGGIDWGEATQSYVIWPLERGGIFVTGEVVGQEDEPGEVTARICGSYSAMPFWVEEVGYDAAGVQSNRTFIATTEELLGRHNRVRQSGGPNTVPVPFNKYKYEVIGYLRRLFKRAAEGYDTRIIAIDPACKELLRQLRNPYIAEDKEDDHGPDGVIAGSKSIAIKHRSWIAREEEAERKAAEAALAEAA